MIEDSSTVTIDHLGGTSSSCHRVIVSSCHRGAESAESADSTESAESADSREHHIICTEVRGTYSSYEAYDTLTT